MNAKKYASPYDFRKALDTKLKALAFEQGIALDQLRKQVTFERFLARLDFDRYRLKGGYSLELRLPQTIRTLDIDLAVLDKHFIIKDQDKQQKAIFDDLTQLLQTDKADFFEFKILRMMSALPDLEDGGYRYHVSAEINGRVYQEFHVDVAVEQNEIIPPEHFQGTELLSFAGIKTVDIAAITKEEVFAQKLHAYVRPRQTENSRVKDLIDMAMLIEAGLIKERLNKAIAITFANSKTYKTIPKELISPPQSWETSFARIAQERGLKLQIHEAFSTVALFFRKLNVE